MLPHYSPFKVAETFTVLAALFPGRIDLGIGRAPGTDPLTTYALQRDRREASPDDFPQQLAELLAYFEDALPSDHPFRRLARDAARAARAAGAWMLGSSPQSAIWAAELGLPYAFADFINPGGAELAAVYRERFNAARELEAPRVAVALSVLCAPTDEEAHRLASSSRMTFTMLRRGQLIQVPPPEKAVAFLAREGQAANGQIPGRRGIVGSPATVRAGIEQATAEYGADEAILVTITHAHEARRRSYELLAEVMELEPRALATAA